MNRFQKRTLEILDSYPDLKKALSEAIQISSDTKYSMRYSFCATGFREALRIFFEDNSPDKEIKKCHWWKPTLHGQHKCSKCGETMDCFPVSGNGITRKDRLHYYIYGPIQDLSIFDTVQVENIDQIMDEYKEAIDKLNKFVHRIDQKNIEKDFEDTIDLIISILNQLLPEIADTLQATKELLESHLGRHLDEVFFEHLFDEVDCLATHSVYDSSSIEEIEIINRDENFIYFTGKGSVSYELTYDRECFGSVSFPFTFNGTMATTELRKIVVSPEDVNVDTSSWAE